MPQGERLSCSHCGEEYNIIHYCKAGRRKVKVSFDVWFASIEKWIEERME